MKLEGIVVATVASITLFLFSSRAETEHPAGMPDLSDRNYPFQYRISLPVEEVMACVENFTGLPCDDWNEDLWPYVQGPITLGALAADSNFLPWPIRNRIGGQNCDAADRNQIITFVEEAAGRRPTGSLGVYLLPSHLETCIQRRTPTPDWPLSQRSVLVITDTGLVGLYDCSEPGTATSPNCGLTYYFSGGRYYGKTGPIPIRSLEEAVLAFPRIVEKLLGATPVPFPADFVVPRYDSIVEIMPEAVRYISQTREATQ